MNYRATLCFSKMSTDLISYHERHVCPSKTKGFNLSILQRFKWHFAKVNLFFIIIKHELLNRRLMPFNWYSIQIRRLTPDSRDSLCFVYMQLLYNFLMMLFSCARDQVLTGVTRENLKQEWIYFRCFHAFSSIQAHPNKQSVLHALLLLEKKG